VKKLLKEYIPQVLLIVFSVVLGLFLSERINKQQEKKMAKQLVSHLKTEVNQWRETMLDWMPYHKDLKNKVDSLRMNDQFIQSFEKNADVFRNLSTQGIFNGTVTSAAWETALLNPAISEISYAQLRDFSKVYTQIDHTTKSLYDVNDLYMDVDINTKGKSRKNLKEFSMLMNEFIGRETRLIFYCNEALGDTLVDQEIFINKLLKNRKNLLIDN